MRIIGFSISSLHRYAICIAEGIILTAMLQIPCIVVKLWRVCREEKDQKNVNIVVSSKSD